MDNRTLKGLCVFALAAVGTLALVAAVPSITPDEVSKAFELTSTAAESAPAATEAEPASEPAVVEINFDDDEALVIEACTPPRCSEVSFDETEEGPIVVVRPSRASALARR